LASLVGASRGELIRASSRSRVLGHPQFCGSDRHVRVSVPHPHRGPVPLWSGHTPRRRS